MFVRKANKEDISQIVRFQLAMARETEGIELDPSTVKKGVSAVLEDSSKGHYYLVEREEEIIGSLLTTYEWSDWKNGTIIWIQSVYVLPAQRRKGVYSKMYLHIKNQVLNSKEFNGIRLYADKNNKPAHKTYQKLGMNKDHYVTFEWLK